MSHIHRDAKSTTLGMENDWMEEGESSGGGIAGSNYDDGPSVACCSTLHSRRA